jgi:hypothetical protein
VPADRSKAALAVGDVAQEGVQAVLVHRPFGVRVPGAVSLKGTATVTESRRAVSPARSHARTAGTFGASLFAELLAILFVRGNFVNRNRFGDRNGVGGNARPREEQTNQEEAPAGEAPEKECKHVVKAELKK